MRKVCGPLMCAIVVSISIDKVVFNFESSQKNLHMAYHVWTFMGFKLDVQQLRIKGVVYKYVH